MKKVVFRSLLAFTLCTMILSIEFSNRTLFDYIHSFHTPYTKNAVSFTKNQVLSSYKFIKSKLTDDAAPLTKKVSSRNKYGHLIYTGTEREKLLKILSKSVKTQ